MRQINYSQIIVDFHYNAYQKTNTIRLYWTRRISKDFIILTNSIVRRLGCHQNDYV